jgi:hypothetical protein
MSDTDNWLRGIEFVGESNLCHFDRMQKADVRSKYSDRNQSDAPAGRVALSLHRELTTQNTECLGPGNRLVTSSVH